MTTLTITVDGSTEIWLGRIFESEQKNMNDVATRLLKRAILAARPRPVYDLEAVRANAAEFADEDPALAESDIVHRAELLAQEDEA